MKHALIFIGTRPEAIKLAPLVSALRARPNAVTPAVCATSQHDEMLKQVFHWFNLTPDDDLQIMRKAQHPAEVFAKTLTGATERILEKHPDLVIVQGDTTTAAAAALAGFYADIPVAHIEAGLRSDNRRAPWPEETHRLLIGKLATLHFAPTEKNAARLREEKSDGEIHVVGNTVLDALLEMKRRLDTDETLKKAAIATVAQAGHTIDNTRPFILVTGHRRESFGDGLNNICRALVDIAEENPHYDIVYAVHLNPQVQETAHTLLSKKKNIRLLPPLDYAAFVLLMSHCRFILTDSGGIQEEAPSLDKPVLVMRNATERPEVIDSGAARLVGTDKKGIVKAVKRLLSDDTLFQSMASAKNPFGDGKSAARIADILAKANF